MQMVDMACADPSLIVITPAMAVGSCLEEFQKRFPNRLIDVGIAEGHAVTFAGGMASESECKVVVCIYATFFQRALDNLFHDVCIQNFPVLFALDRASLSGPDGMTHHGIYDIAFLNAMPNLVIAQPRDGHVLKELLKSAFMWKKPTAIRYPNLETSLSDKPLQCRDLGRAEIVENGDTILIVALGHTITTAINVRKILQSSGINATVVDPVFIKPLDEELFKQLVITHSYVVTIEEHSVIAGFGMIFNRFIMQNGLKEIEVLNIGIADRFVPFGSHEELIRELELDPQSIATRILKKWAYSLC